MKTAVERPPGMDNVDSRAWTGFTVFSRVRHPLVAMAAFDDAGNDTAEFRAFVAQRFGEDSETQAGKVSRTLQYERCTPEMQKLILAARLAEWSEYKSFNAAMPIRGKELEELLQEGHVPIPMQWVDVDKQAHLTGTPEHQPENRSRLVACGNHELVSRGAQGIRCDSPTAETEGRLQAIA